MKLIKNIQEVQNIIPVSMTSEIEVIKPFFTTSERILIGLIGKEQFESLKTAYESESTDAIIKEAIEFAQRVIVCLGYHSALPILSVKIGNAGITINSNADTKQAFSWQVGKVEKSLLELGFGAVEDLLELLERDSAKFPEYHNSDEFKRQKQYLISTAADFTDYFNIGRSRYVFHSMSYIMRRIEEQELNTLFGTDFIESLKNPPSATPLSEAQLKLLKSYIKPGIALLTAAKALKERIITFENGVATINLHGNYDVAKKELVADKQTIDNAFTQLTEDGNRFLQDGLAMIIEKLGDFPGYTAPESKRKLKITNDREKGIWAN